MKRLSAILLCLLALVGCSGQSDLPSGRWLAADGSSGLASPCLTLDREEGRFSFLFDLLSSYLPSGSYVVEDGILTATTHDGKYRYLFRVLEDGALEFLQEGSSPITVIDRRLSPPVEDGTIFLPAEEVP